MAIQRQAENPGESLVLDEPIRYSIKTSKKKTPVPAKPPAPLHTVADVKKDVIYTVAVFGGILILLIALYLKMR